MPFYMKTAIGTATALGLCALSQPLAAQVWMDPSNNPRYAPIVRPYDPGFGRPAYQAPPAPRYDFGRPVYVQPAPTWRPAYEAPRPVESYGAPVYVGPGRQGPSMQER